jgi:hypothetical protein
MKTIGMVVTVVGIALLVLQMVLAATSYHLTRSHDMHRFMLWMAVGLVVAIVGAVMVKKADQ